VTGALRRNLPSVFFSLLLNAGVLFGLALLQRAVASQGLDLMLESVFSEEIPQEEMTRDLELDTAPAETLNVIAGGTPSTAVGAAAEGGGDEGAQYSSGGVRAGGAIG
jgi:hypothetical protein